MSKIRTTIIIRNMCLQVTLALKLRKPSFAENCALTRSSDAESGIFLIFVELTHFSANVMRIDITYNNRRVSL